MCPPDDLLTKFIEKIQIIISEKKIDKLKIFTSAEAHGKQAEYIRFGMNYDKWLSNIYRVYKEVPEIEFTIMSTYNVLSIPSYTKFLDDVLEIKRQFGSAQSNRNPMLLDIPYLRFPEHQSMFILDQSMVKTIHDQVTHMYRNLECKSWEGTANKGFHEHEADKLKRIYEMGINSVAAKNKFVDINRIDFVKFVDEHDRRRGTNFLQTFPELGEFYDFCKSLG
jgi:hypothetical protein